MPFVRRQRKYYKYEYSPNVTKVGSPTIKDNIVSGFSSANHLKFPVTITSDSITEGQVCFTTGSDVTTRQGLFLCATTDNSTSFCIDGGALKICNKVYGSYPSFVNLGLSVVANTKYYLRFTQNGKSIVPSLSTDGSSYTTGNTVTRSQAFGSNIGYGISNDDVNRPFLGSIDLRNSYIKQSGILFWEGVKKTTSLGSSSDYDDYEDVNKLYNLVRRKIGYWKYQEWKQPTLTSATSNGVITASSDHSTDPSSPWYVLSASTYIGGRFIFAGSSSEHLIWQLPEPVKVNSCEIYNSNETSRLNRFPKSIVIYVSDNGSSWVEVGNASEYAQPASATSVSISCNASKVYKYIKFQFTNTFGDTPMAVGVIRIKGQIISATGKDDYDYYTDKLVSYSPTVQDYFTYRKLYKETATGTYTITLDKDYEGNLLFVGNGGGGGSSQNNSYWRNSSGGSGACFQGRVRLPRGTYTLTIGTLGYGYNIGNTANMTGGVDSTDSYLTDENGNELIRVGCGIRGTVIGTGGAGGTLTLGTLEVLETTKAVNGNQGDAWGPVYGQGKQVFATSAYDGTTTGYGAGTSSYYGGSNVYGVAGIFKLDIEYLDKGLRSY